MKSRYCEVKGTDRQVEHLISVLDGDTELDNLIERIEVATGLYPNPLHFTIQLVYYSDDVWRQMCKWYPGKAFAQTPGYTDNERKTILLATHNLTKRVIVHELTHMLLNLHFIEPKIPIELHEIISQTMEGRIK